ncbi:hypothetical protein ACIBUY_27540 [Streptomyces sp. NPDC050085]|uniref:hypothetical protein n=1 Tax=Streptomyces sp. NPDC050085 TaxID=3365600 RepID=UPI0037AFC655
MHAAAGAVDHMNVHSTSTSLDDRTEAAVLRTRFGHRPAPSVQGKRDFQAASHLHFPCLIRDLGRSALLLNVLNFWNEWIGPR